MNITILTTSFPEYPGDLAGNFILYLARELSSQSLTIRVIAPHSPKTPKYEHFDNVMVHRFQYLYPAKWQRVSYGYGIPTNLKISGLAKLGLLPFLMMFCLSALRFKKDSDLYHGQWIFSGLVAVLGKWYHHKPIILTVRGSDLNLAKGKLLKWLVKAVLNRVAIITTVSGALRKEVLRLGIPAEKVYTIPNGIDCQLFQKFTQQEMRRKLNLPAAKKIVLWIGRFVSIKGVKYLIQAIPAVLSQNPETLFVLVGAGDLENQIKTDVRQMELKQSVLFTGKIVSAAIPLWLNAADIFVLPSLNEGRPNVILEAMACEIPIVATNVGGIPELVHDGQNGFLVPAKNSPVLAERLIQLLRNKSLRSEMGQLGRKMIFEMGLSWEQCAKEMVSLYQQAVGRRQ